MHSSVSNLKDSVSRLLKQKNQCEIIYTITFLHVLAIIKSCNLSEHMIDS